jgi:hypothetical protein
VMGGQDDRVFRLVPCILDIIIDPVIRLIVQI